MNMENTHPSKGSQAESKKRREQQVLPADKTTDERPRRKRPLPWDIRPGAIMQSQTVIEILGISPGTWRKWKKNGLRTITGFGCRAELVSTDAVFEFLMKERVATA